MQNLLKGVELAGVARYIRRGSNRVFALPYNGDGR